MFARLLLIAVVAIGLWALFAHDTSAGGPGSEYRVRPGDTLWSISVAHYGGDPREGVWNIRERNRLESTTIVPGQLLVLP